uniref:Glutaredoxin domain-containing protein n=1 Tax=Macrostomum lignano TaxID=282301 RepID=A0A1I8JIJ7_9PLAT
MSLKLFVSSVSGNMKIKERQAYVKRILDSLNVQYEEIDISDDANAELKAQMQTAARSHGKPVVPPHLMRDDAYLGDGDDFSEAVEVDTVGAFLQLPSAAGDENGNKDLIKSGDTAEKAAE